MTITSKPGHLQQKKQPSPLVEISDIRIYYTTTAGEAKVVDGVNLTIRRDEIFGLAGESLSLIHI